MDPAHEVILQLVNVAVHKKIKVQNTNVQMQKKKLFCTELCTCGTEYDSCNNLMQNDKSVDEDSLTDDM